VSREQKRVNFHFRCQVYATSEDGKLFRYLQSEDTEFSLREMITWAVSGYWMPFAHKHHGDLSDQELKLSAQRSIHRLQQQILYLEESFGLKPTAESRVGKLARQTLSNPFAEVQQLDESRLANRSSCLEIEIAPTSLDVKKTLESSDDIEGDGQWDDAGI